MVKETTSTLLLEKEDIFFPGPVKLLRQEKFLPFSRGDVRGVGTNHLSEMKRKNKYNIFYPKHTKAKRRYFQNNMTKAEIKLWSVLKGRKLLEKKFQRQHGIGDYVVDFYCPEIKLAIEVDGESHYEKEAIFHDIKRDQFLNKLGIGTIRFTNYQVLENLDGVLLKIKNKIQELGNK